MVLAESFEDLIQKRAMDDPAFAEALLREGVNALLTGEVDAGKLLLHDYITATVGFEALGEATGIGVKSLVRMLGPHGNPQARKLFDVVKHLQRHAGVVLHVKVVPANREDATF